MFNGVSIHFFSGVVNESVFGLRFVPAAAVVAGLAVNAALAGVWKAFVACKHFRQLSKSVAKE